MTFANPWPWWAILPAVAVLGALAFRAYARAAIPLAPRRRALLTGLRFLTLLLLLVFLMRPVWIDDAGGPGGATVAVLLDASRSMRIPDVDGAARLDAAAEILRQDLVPALSREFQVDVLSFGERVSPIDPGQPVAADARRTDLTGALSAVRERYRQQSLAGVILLSDGGDTGERDVAAHLSPGGPPVYAVGIGSSRIARDREVLSVTAGEAALAESVIELGATIVSHGYGREPVEVRLLEDGRPIQVRRVTPADDGSPVREVFHVAPKRDAATLYSIEIPAHDAELVKENNTRGVLVRPPGRKRRLLMIQGAPGYEHSFLLRAWAEDQGLEVDTVVRKGQNERGEDTFYILGDAERSAGLTLGFPATREDLFQYDGLVLANVEGEFFGREQIAEMEAFVAERGGGVLVLGARSFQGRGYEGTALEEVLPLELSDRGGGVVRTGVQAGDLDRAVLTEEGRAHPIMQLGADPQDTPRKWEALPALAGSTALGGARAGATVLAVTAGPGGIARPLLAVQRYGRGRSMIFAGEGAWRWRMMLPTEDRSYETFWRQVARWLSASAPDRLTLSLPAAVTPGEMSVVDLDVRDRRFEPVRDATLTLRVSGPGAPDTPLQAGLSDAASGRYRAQFRAEQPGVYRLTAEARRGSEIVAVAEDWLLVGDSDLELTDPRRNDEVLKRVAEASGGRLLGPDEVGRVPSMLEARKSEARPVEYRDLWNNGWTFGLIVLLLGVEWSLRRQAGLR